MSLCLAGVAGWVDAVGLLRTGDLFVSFASGDTTHLAAGLSGVVSNPARPAAVVAAFLGGVVAGELIAGPAEKPRRALVLACEAVLLGAAWACSRLGSPGLATAAILAFAMGTQNASVHAVGGVSIALTYVTGAYVNVGRGIANALAGRASLFKAAPYAGLILALAAGAWGAAALIGRLGDQAIAVASGACLLIATWRWLTPAKSSAG